MSYQFRSCWNVPFVQIYIQVHPQRYFEYLPYYPSDPILILYLFIGPDYAKVTTVPDNQTQAQTLPNERPPINELDEYWNVRYLTATEGIWRIFGFHVTSKYPSVSPLPVHLPNSVRHTQYYRRNETASSMSLLKRYFARPEGHFEFDVDPGLRSFDSLKYMEYFRFFRLDTWDVRAPGRIDNIRYFAEYGLGEQDIRKLVIKRSKLEHLARLVAAKPSEGERFYIRVLLQHRPARSFEELRTVDGHIHPNFQTAAVSLGLFAGEREAEYALAEAVRQLYTAPQLIRLFVDILINECTNTPLQLWLSFRDNFAENHFQRTQSQATSYDLTLEDIGRQLEEYGKTLHQYGLPSPIVTSTEVQHELERWAPHAGTMRVRARRSLALFNPDQRRIFDKVISAIHHNRPLLLFVDGKAGRGKTFLINTICDELRSQGKIVIPTATSAFAAQLYSGGRTAHSAFKVCLSCSGSHSFILKSHPMIYRYL